MIYVNNISTIRVTSLWDGLPDSMVSAVPDNSFKNRLDKLRKTEKARFDYKVELSVSRIARNLQFIFVP